MPCIYAGSPREEEFDENVIVSDRPIGFSSGRILDVLQMDVVPFADYPPSICPEDDEDPDLK